MDKYKKELIIASIVFWILLLIGFYAAINDPLNKVVTTAPAKEEVTRVEPPKERMDKLELDIRSTIYGLKITNKQPETLTNCELKVNGSYSMKVPSISSDDTYINYGQLTKGDGEKFDMSKYDLKDILINRCEGQEFRVGTYSFN